MWDGGGRRGGQHDYHSGRIGGVDHVEIHFGGVGSIEVDLAVGGREGEREPVRVRGKWRGKNGGKQAGDKGVG